jgi:hypothetical protein
MSRGPRAAAGAAMILVGSLVLVGLVFISNDSAPLSERLLFGLGLPGMALVSALAQILVFGGLATLWAIVHRKP